MRGLSVLAQLSPNFKCIHFTFLWKCVIPVVTVMGVQLGLLLGGAVVIEQIFGLPGIGWMILNGIYQRDYTLVQGGVLFIAVVFVLINLLVDVLYAYVDPRIRYD